MGCSTGRGFTLEKQLQQLLSIENQGPNQKSGPQATMEQLSQAQRMLSAMQGHHSLVSTSYTQFSAACDPNHFYKQTNQHSHINT